MPTPDFLPSLSAGAHDAEQGEACVMEYVSLLAGEEWSDRPECTHPLLAHEARTTNDLLRDGDRSRLVPLIGRLFGTTEDSPELRARLRITQARQVIALLEPSARPRALAAVERAESWIGREGTDDDVRDAFHAAMSFPIAHGELDPEHVEFHTAMSRMFPFAMTPELEAAEAYALTALVGAHRIAAGECRADCGNGPARARRMVKDLAGLVDTYDEVTGRIPHEVTAELVREMADVLS
ncbi:hypothetical protein [Aeromicrobium wangtongii]|uniref:DUF222 domain-containing protein n=1 Tax=Aeromicrobium wangtongii TaxID=2969247 RepID=A0ABY5MDS0_9ACTN|nr:hypothetical protein [Aeromicrobium wangtongii]MCD9197339.1 hypothetical protein [Aeromicrobium wangtongii]UUP14833.1 hypothetical protein NQV15_05845 [Aeromicrobium wangtongii]